MPRRNGRLHIGTSRRDELRQAFRELDTPAKAITSWRQRVLDAMSGRGFWFWVAAALFGVAVGLFIAREPVRRGRG
jgi:hypothetical protein